LTASGVEVLLGGTKGQVLQFISYGGIDGVDVADGSVLRLVIGDGPVGAYIFYCSNPKRVQERIVRNRARFIQLENIRIAQLVQSADFRGKLQQNQEFAEALRGAGGGDAAASGVDPYAPEAIYAAVEKNSKARAVMSKLARGLTIKKRAKSKGAPRKGTANDAALAPRSRPNEPLPPPPEAAAAASGKPQDLPPPHSGIGRTLRDAGQRQRQRFVAG